MTALGKTLAASTLAVGLAVFVSGTASATSSYNDWNDKDYKNNKRDYKQDDKKWDKDYNKRDFYKLSWDDQYRLCNDSDYWNSWGWYYGDRDDKCRDIWNKHDNKDSSKDYSKDLSYNDSFYKKDTDHEKTAYSVETAKHDSDNYGNRSYDSSDYGDSHDGWSKHGDDSWNNGSYSQGSSDYGYSNADSNYKAEGYHQKDSVNVVTADVGQYTSVDNRVNVYGDNNNVYNTINVANYANVEQKVASTQVDYAAVEYNKSSNSGYGSNDYGSSDHSYGNDGWKDNDQGYASNDWGNSSYGNSSHDETYKAAVYFEKSSTSEVKKSSNYNLNETYRSSENDDDDYCYQHDEYSCDNDHDDDDSYDY